MKSVLILDRSKLSLNFKMKGNTLVFKTTLFFLFLVLLLLLNVFYEEIQWNKDLYKRVIAMHKNVRDVTELRQVCFKKIGKEEMLLVDKVS